MDKTHEFKAAVLALKVQRKTEQVAPAAGKESQRPRNKPNSPRDEFARQVKEACHKISMLRNFLLENRAAYMRIGQHLKSAARMSDEQRDLIDRECEKFVLHYTQHLGQLRSEWQVAQRKPHQRQHMEAVLELLGDYLRNVQHLYLQQKKFRVQHELDTFRMLKLASGKKLAGLSLGHQHVEAEVEQVRPVGQESPKLRRRGVKKGRESLVAEERQLQMAVDEDWQKSQEEAAATKAAQSLSPEDVQLFEQENELLFEELQGVSQDIEAIEKNVVEIAQLQNIFSEKVSTQQYNIERITNAVVGATENVKDANEQIRRAIQRNAGLRVWTLFFLLVMSFALLFLDWYYD